MCFALTSNKQQGTLFCIYAFSDPSVSYHTGILFLLGNQLNDYSLAHNIKSILSCVPGLKNANINVLSVQSKPCQLSGCCPVVVQCIRAI